MSTPTRPVPDEQVRRFGLALCEHLGLNPDEVGERFDWEVNGGDELGKVTFTAYLPAEEILAMFNGAAQIAAP